MSLNVYLIIFVLVALCALVYPCRKHTKHVILLGLSVAGMLSIAYLSWGGLGAWVDYLQAQSQEAISKQLETKEGIQHLISQMLPRLDNTPQSAHGWYLVGKLYMMAGDEKNAKAAFDKSASCRGDRAN